MTMIENNEPQTQEFEDERDPGTPEPQPQVIEHEPPKGPITKGALESRGVDALDRARVDQVKVSPIAGGVAFATALEVMEFAKMMAVAGKAVPKHLRINPGACLAITFQAVEWRMSPFAVANKSYEVNDRIAYESQLLHAVIEARAPLRERLSVAYEGEGPERVCIVTGKFRDGTTREYRSPKFKDIRVKNSPLWKDDPDQQQFYYASRSWARRWCPDVLLGIYTMEEMQEVEPVAGGAGDGLMARLAGADKTEGHQPGGAERELAAVASDATTQIKPAKGEAAKPAAATKKKPGPKPKAKTTEEPKRATTLANPKNAVTKTEAGKIADRAEAQSKARAQTAKQETDAPPAKPKVPEIPKTSAEYQLFADDWIARVSDPEAALKRWDEERDMRDDLSVPVKVRNDLRDNIDKKHGV